MKSIATALTTMRRSPYQALISILMVTLTFFVGYGVSLILVGTNTLLNYFETQPQIVAFFELDTDQATLTKIQEQTKAKDYVKDVKLITQDQAYELYKDDNQEDPLLLELVTADILPASIEVSTYSISELGKVKEDLEKIDTIEEVVYQQDLIETLSRWTNNLRVVGITMVSVLALVSFLTIMVIIALKASNQKTAISIMRLIGASRAYIRRPFIMEGALYGLAGASIGWIISTLIVIYLFPQIKAFIGNAIVLDLPLEMLLIQLAIGLAIGLFFGGFAGLVAVSRLIKR